MQIEQYFDALRLAHDGELPLYPGQEDAIRHHYDTPLWMIAGPGTGKTHTLVWLVLKRILVDGIEPNRLILTTFTRKAARELESRLILSRQKLVEKGVQEAVGIEVSQIYIGTLHSLCSRLLQDQRYEPTLRIRMLEDELVQQFFLRRTSNPLVHCDSLAFWQTFGMVSPNDRFAPNKSKCAENACKLFNRITENSADLDLMASSGDFNFMLLSNSYQVYQERLKENHRTDQAHLQKHFLDYLGTPAGLAWLDDGFTLLVDEYQDTNPIQEQIYFRLAGTKGDFTVCGDDDQSLYRFRGATVEALIDFDQACQIYLGKTPTAVYLSENRRSHPDIVAWVNRYILNHPEMMDDNIRVRAPGKPKLEAKASVGEGYPAVLAIAENDMTIAGTKVARLIQALKAEGKIQDYSQVALLTFSTKENSHGIGNVTTCLRNAGIPFCNPRNRTVQLDQRFQAMLGAFSWILDPSLAITTLPAQLPGRVPAYLVNMRQEYQRLYDSGLYPELAAYVDASIDAIKKADFDPNEKYNFLERKGGRRITLSGLLYKLLAQEPFATDLTDAEGGERLKALNLIMAEYESLYDEGELRIEADPAGGVRIDRWALYNFYAVFVEGIHDGMNDPEDDEVSIQEGMVNIMTIHQSKGLEFEVVFVLRPDKQPYAGDTHVLEDVLDPFITRPTKPATRRSQQMRAAEDAIRLFFVAYSRAKRLLVLTGTHVDKWHRVLGFAPGTVAINRKNDLTTQLGVPLL